MLFGAYWNLSIVLLLTAAVLILYFTVGRKHICEGEDLEGYFWPDDIPKLVCPNAKAPADAPAKELTGIAQMAAENADFGDAAEALYEEEMHTMQIPAQPKPVPHQEELFPLGVNKEVASDVLMPEMPLAFGYKICWLAISGVKPAQVAHALQLRDITPANWTQGLTDAYADNGQVFVSPALNGWVLVVGRALWNKVDMNQNIEENEWLYHLSRHLGDVYYFSTLRDLDNHAWAKIHNGHVKRAYAYSGEMGEVMWDKGNPTREEEELGLDFPEHMQAGESADTRLPNEYDVLAMAAAWSIDTSFSTGKYRPDLGFVGRI